MASGAFRLDLVQDQDGNQQAVQGNTFAQSHKDQGFTERLRVFAGRADCCRSCRCNGNAAADAGKTVAQLLGEVEIKASRTLVLEPGAYPPALVLANFKEKDLDTLLDLMKQAQVIIPLKAVVTPSNKNWVFGDLLAHLSEEHVSFTSAAKEQA